MVKAKGATPKEILGHEITSTMKLIECFGTSSKFVLFFNPKYLSIELFLTLLEMYLCSGKKLILPITGASAQLY